MEANSVEKNKTYEATPLASWQTTFANDKEIKESIRPVQKICSAPSYS
jgi:hypothetical protein